MSASSARPTNPVSTTYAALALAFFFAMGLAGGTAYKLLVVQRDSDEHIARTTPGADGPAPDFALAHLTPTAPPALAPAPAPAGLPPNILATPFEPGATLAAPPAAPVAPTPAPTAQAAPAPAPDKAATTTSTPSHAVVQRQAPPPKKPRAIVPAKQEAPKAPAIVLHAPPRAPATAGGPFRVQFGAFANEENAHRVQWAIEATGLKVEVSQAPGSTKGDKLYYLRSPLYPDYAAALGAAQAVQARVQHFVNAIPIDYAILGDRNKIEQQASAR